MPSKRTHTNIGELKVTTFEAPPEGFDPLTAPPSKLLRHGVAPRPDPDKEPELYKKWHQVYSKQLIHIVPEFRKNEYKHHGTAAGRSAIKNGTSTSTNWSGVVVPAPAGDTFKWITGNWIVPDPNQPPGQATGQWYYSSAWIGIDGWGSADVLQAGTSQDVLVQNGVTHKSVYAWWEWYPNYEVAISNFPVSSGDYMTCLICSTGATTATVYLTNLSTNTHVSFNITIPSGATFKGNCAEWIALLCEPVQPPQGELEHIHYFCGNTEIADDLKEHETQRVALYKSTAALVRAYANIADDLPQAGYTGAQVATIKQSIDHRRPVTTKPRHDPRLCHFQTRLDPPPAKQIPRTRSRNSPRIS